MDVCVDDGGETPMEKKNDLLFPCIVLPHDVVVYIYIHPFSIAVLVYPNATLLPLLSHYAIRPHTYTNRLHHDE